MEEAEALCDRIAVMVNGKVQAIGTPQRLKNTYGAGYKISVKTLQPKDAVAQLMHEKLGVRLVQKLGCHLDLEYERPDHHQDQENAAVSTAATLSEMFDLLERARETHGVIDYSVGQTTLGQVFVSFAERQHQN
jgi:ABC-type multidrug transport system ATPase subunit